jgi:hypothetical protein
MKPQLTLLPRRSIVVQAPRVGPPACTALAGCALACFLGLMAAWGLTGSHPGFLQPAMRAGSYPLGFRIFVISLGFAGGIAGLLAVLGYSGLAWTFLSLRLGLRRLRESEGPCTVVHQGPDLWGLRLDLTGSDGAQDLQPAAGETSPRADRADGSGRSILFRCDEAAAAPICRISDPGDQLLIRWVDPLLSLSGPLLLEVVSRRAAGGRQEIPQEEGLRKAA